MLNVIAIISVALFSLTALAIGAHLIVLSARTRKAPELLLGLSFILALIGNVIIVGVIDSRYVEEPGGPNLARLGTVFLASGFAFMAAFNARVFRPGVNWAIGLAWLLGGGLFVVETVTWAAIEGMEGYYALFGVKFGLRIAIYVWSAAEAFRYYRLMIIRMRHGLADAVLANRFLLWGIASCLALLVVAAFDVADILGFRTPEGDLLETIGSLIGAPATALVWLTFFPPAAYRRYILGRFRASKP